MFGDFEQLEELFVVDEFISFGVERLFAVLQFVEALVIEAFLQFGFVSGLELKREFSVDVLNRFKKFLFDLEDPVTSRADDFEAESHEVDRQEHGAEGEQRKEEVLACEGAPALVDRLKSSVEEVQLLVEVLFLARREVEGVDRAFVEAFFGEVVAERERGLVVGVAG